MSRSRQRSGALRPSPNRRRGIGPELWITGPGRWIAGAALAGLAVRLAVTKALATSVLFRAPLLDAAAYERWARAIAGGDLRGEGVFHLAPLYPYLCGLVFALVPDGPLTVVLIQHLVGVALAVGAGAVAFALGGRVAGAVAAGLVALHGPLIAHENALLPEILGAALLTGGVVLLATGAGKTGGIGARRSIAAGLLLGLDALVRPTALLVAALLAIWLLVRAPGRRVVAALAFVLGVLVAIAPVTVRNRVVGGEWVLITGSGGFNFYVGNHAEADGSYVQPRGVPFAPGDRADFTGRSLAERARGRALTAGQVSDYWRDKALVFIRRQPGRALGLFLRKLALVWNRAEIPQIIDLPSLRQEAPVLRLAFVGAWVLMPLGLLGLVFAYPRRIEREVMVVSLVAFTIATGLFFVTDRYRMQAVPLIAIVAGGAAARLVEVARERRKKALAWGVAGLLAAVVVVQPQWLGLGGEVGRPWVPPLQRALALLASSGSSSPPDGTDSAAVEAAFAEAAARGPGAAPVFANRGEWRRRIGRSDSAQSDLERALALDPEDPRGWTSLGLVHAAAGADSAAVPCFGRARSLDPSYAPAALALGQALLRLKRPQAAIAPLREAIALAEVDSAAANDALGIALVLTGDRTEGWSRLERAVERAPNRPDFALHLGLALADGGEIERGTNVLRAAAARNPAYRPVRLALIRLELEHGDRQAALQEVEALLARDPADREALVLRERLGGARR